MADHTDTLSARFWSKVDRKGPDECWPWMASKTKKGGGIFRLDGESRGIVAARRVAYELTSGAVPAGMSVRVSCADRSCCNGSHLFLKPISISPEERIEKNRKRHRLVKIIRDPVARSRISNKTTYIYGLIDPRSHECRYVGKTVLTPDRRLCVHKWRSKAEGHKGHSMAWIMSLRTAGIEAEVVTLEEIAPGGDWVEAEQFWIEYLRWLGADLCNHSIGGEGATGAKHTPEMIAKRTRRGKDNKCSGRPMPAHVKAAILAGGARMRSDPIRRQAAYEAQMAGFTPEVMANSIAALKRVHSDPETHAAAVAKRTAKARLPESREMVSRQSLAQWAENRAYIIARQNSGKGDEWRRKNSEAQKAAWSVPGNKMALAMARRRKLSDEDITVIRSLVSGGVSQTAVAKQYNVVPSAISKILSGQRRSVLAT